MASAGAAGAGEYPSTKTRTAACGAAAAGAATSGTTARSAVVVLQSETGQGEQSGPQHPALAAAAIERGSASSPATRTSANAARIPTPDASRARRISRKSRIREATASVR